jgi:cell division protein FtsB
LVTVSKAPATSRPESIRPLVAAVILLFVALLTLAGLKGYRDLKLGREREHQLATRIDETQTNIERLRGRIERLKSDPATLERTARAELGMVRAHDVVIELPATGDWMLTAPLPAPPPRSSPPPAAPAAPAPSVAPVALVGPQLPTDRTAPAAVVGPPAASFVGPPLPPPH